MKKVILERFAYSPMGAFGVLTVDDFKCYTVERPWLDNKARESCIPEGSYRMQLGMYNRGGYPAYEIMDVPDRSLIKMHIANNIDDILGCIGFGLELGCVDKKWAVTNSKRAMNDFMAAMEGQSGEIIITSKQIFGWG
ncbi:MAG: hypothetical protein Unbinned3818contig1000_29 [Prokaryotic dsDNA virus sp.]|nr:hypothetical protein [Phycisphaerae bacterium]QDP45958.1 MAG: hypothetical protein Unbinned3818contig1000_29 [Prokaryotic dsDNA virus sp.]|tara:strand:- start:554 stop:967 length:414 start_codon:yes stop_codon:yes gene_type:complete